MFRNVIVRRMRSAVALLALLAAVGIAWASWTSSQSGNIGTRAATMTFTVTAATPASGLGNLFPSVSPTGSVTFEVDNPNAFPIHVSALAANGLITSSNELSCPASNVVFTAVSGLTGTSYDVAASTNDVLITVPSVLTMALTAPNACQNLSFTVPVTVTATAF